MDAYGAAPAKIVSSSGKVCRPDHSPFPPLLQNMGWGTHASQRARLSGNGEAEREMESDEIVWTVAGVSAPVATFHGEHQVSAPARPVRLDSAVEEAGQSRLASGATERFPEVWIRPLR